eukprot:SAG31_NODE_4123_length_3561_cov_3.577701_2_plen_85_part_00
MLLSQAKGQTALIDHLQTMLADRGVEDGFPICSHEGEAEIWTTAAYIIDLASGVLMLCIGPPDSNAFLKYKLEGDTRASGVARM